MPVIKSTYTPPTWAKNGYVSTVYSGLYRKVTGVGQKRERITLSDGDFLDLDWSYSETKAKGVIILLHGLEGNGQRPYMLGTAKLFNQNGFDAVAVNFRGCSGEDNLMYRSYHSGATEDLIDVISHINKNYVYEELYIKGISLGANLALKYVGEGNVIPEKLKAIIAVSVPCDLNGSCEMLHHFKNKPYAINFLSYLKRKLKIKQLQYPEKLSIKDFNSIKTLRQFDDVYTSKAHGFKDSFDYYEQCSSLQFLKNIKVPSLIINATNDSFLSESCFPIKEAENNPKLYLEMPKHGGHVGFIDNDNVYYNERRALEFVQQRSEL
ncbi:alpha/beta fold hydrolase [Winogradskyella maritima]|uniref:YheT family hydrolase n=1 Tax=Winogradskyella maritima TaxID=1517766 RepID=A0ABV8AHL4_9FLAO|nr:alpha/beta fold hydrolase [Winogradskyella maritima]